MKTKMILTLAGVIGAFAFISAGYCFWLMDNPLSYRWVPVVVTGFLLAILVFITSFDYLFCRADTIASIHERTEYFPDHAHLTNRLKVYAKGIHQSG